MRRRSLGALGGGLALGGLTARQGANRVQAAGYVVGVGRSTDAYEATRRAVVASGEWPVDRLAGATVVIKPNLVVGLPSTTGITTDPHVVRALVDLALQNGAARVLIAETGSFAPDFAGAGYSFFSTYDPLGRVILTNLNALSPATIPVVQGLAYRELTLARVLADPKTVFISAAKLKCHSLAMATLTIKNLFGLPTGAQYYNSQLPQQSLPWPRNTLHLRGMDQSAVDLCVARPVDFAVIDGIWGMEGNGPGSGTPVRMDLVVAGRNALAVDLVGLDVMSIPVMEVPHLRYAMLRGLGPWTLGGVTRTGDSYTPRLFARTPRPPQLWMPLATPSTFSPSTGQQTAIGFRLDSPCAIRAEITRTSESSPSVVPVRLLRQWESAAAGTLSVTWDGRGNDGQVVPPGIYTMQITAFDPRTFLTVYASHWLTVS